MGICLSRLCPSVELTEDPATRTIPSHHASLAQRKTMAKARLPHELSRCDLRVHDMSRPTTRSPRFESEKRGPSRQKSTESERDLALSVPQVMVTPVDGEFPAELKQKKKKKPSDIVVDAAQTRAAPRDSACGSPLGADLDAEKKRLRSDALWEPGYDQRKRYRASY